MSKRHITDFFAPKAKKTVEIACSTSTSSLSFRMPEVSPSSSSTSTANSNNSAKSKMDDNAISITAVPNKECSESKCTWYHGHKLDVSWLLSSFPNVLERIKLGKRSGLKCTLCYRHLSEAKKFSHNGQIPMADGARADGTKELRRIVDHLGSDAHQAAVRLDKAQRLWLSQSDKHPWIRILKSHEAEVVSMLIELAVDVYNDSKTMSLSAHSWPSRSLATMHANNQISAYREQGLDSTFAAFNPPASVFHYRDPNIYRNMLDIVAEVVMEPVVQNIQNADCFSIQVDGSVDKYSIDNKFITARYINNEKAIVNIFLGESHSDKRGSEGLLDSVLLIFRKLGIEGRAKETLTGLTTDGESANTGRKGGLWAKFREYLERDVLCIWCVAHRADLAFSDVEAGVAEIRHWRTNVKSVASFYRSSAVRTDELKQIADASRTKFYRFPEHFEVRFVEHLINMCEAVLKNLPSIRKHWNSIIQSEHSNRNEKATARGFLKIWEESSDQVYYTGLMLDVLALFCKLQTESQKDMVTLCDIEISKTSVLISLSLMESDAFPGGQEEKIATAIAAKERESTGTIGNNESRNKRNIHNSLVTRKRCRNSVRSEIILSAKEFISQRLSDDQNDTYGKIKRFLDARSISDFIEATREVVEKLFGSDYLKQFIDELIAHFASDNLPVPANITDNTGKLFYLLKISVPRTVFSKLVQTYVILTPHSCGPERAVSCHTILKSSKQSCLSRDAINSRMCIALNSAGTAHFDPRPAVAKFLERKERRYNIPDTELYRNREFVKKFFANDM